jgi:predicted metal-dependent HD superfamily phosphohydrolase
MNNENSIFETIQPRLQTRLVSELKPQYYYHQWEHTLSVIHAAETIACWEAVSADDLFLLKTAALYHDSGFLFRHKGHEEYSVQLAREDLPQFGFSEEEIRRIIRMIEATKLPQNPEDELSRILCDADLFYLGSGEYEVIAELLYKELLYVHEVKNRQEWMKQQIDFLSNHHFHTSSAAQRLTPKKNEHLKKLLSNL